MGVGPIGPFASFESLVIVEAWEEGGMMSIMLEQELDEEAGFMVDRVMFRLS